MEENLGQIWTSGPLRTPDVPSWINGHLWGCRCAIQRLLYLTIKRSSSTFGESYMAWDKIYCISKAQAGWLKKKRGIYGIAKGYLSLASTEIFLQDMTLGGGCLLSRFNVADAPNRDTPAPH